MTSQGQQLRATARGAPEQYHISFEAAKYRAPTAPLQTVLLNVTDCNVNRDDGEDKKGQGTTSEHEEHTANRSDNHVQYL